MQQWASSLWETNIVHALGIRPRNADPVFIQSEVAFLFRAKKGGDDMEGKQGGRQGGIFWRDAQSHSKTDCRMYLDISRTLQTGIRRLCAARFSRDMCMQRFPFEKGIRTCLST